MDKPMKIGYNRWQKFQRRNSMKQLRTKYHRWLVRNRDKGIPNLMLFVMLANVLIYCYCTIANGSGIYSALCYDSAKILHGQVWRLFSYVFTYCFSYGGGVISFYKLLLSAYFFWWIGKLLESVWGTLRQNLYFGGAILLTSVVALILYPILKMDVYVTPYYAFLSLFLAAATLAPEQEVYVFFVIPIKMRWAALIDIGLTVYEVARFTVFYRPVWLSLIVFGTAAIIAFLNYALTFGRDVANIFPHRGYRRRRPTRPIATPPENKKTAARPYRHKCTVCGRTDVDYPDLEFRYCSKCKGYYCYCIDHINNHTHIQ